VRNDENSRELPASINDPKKVGIDVIGVARRKSFIDQNRLHGRIMAPSSTLIPIAMMNCWKPDA
jgi:hypothetical protein